MNKEQFLQLQLQRNHPLKYISIQPTTTFPIGVAVVIQKMRGVVEDNYGQLGDVQTNEHSEMRQIVRAIRRDKN